MAEVAGARPAGFRVMDLLAEWRGFWYSFWGVFGGFNVSAPPWFYALTGSLSLVAGAGLVLGLIRHAQRRRLPAHRQSHLLLITFIALTFVGLVRWTLMTVVPQGRLMFAAIAPIAFYLALGLLAWLPARWHAAATRLLAVGLAAVALGIPWAAIRPAYQPLVPIQELPAGAVALDVRCGDDIVLAGYRLDKDTTLAGQPLAVTLYWIATGQPDANLDLSLNGYGYQLENVAKLTPGRVAGCCRRTIGNPACSTPIDTCFLLSPTAIRRPSSSWVSIGIPTCFIHCKINRCPAPLAGSQLTASFWMQGSWSASRPSDHRRLLRPSPPYSTTFNSCKRGQYTQTDNWVWT